jgi:hypothetical protein
VLAVDNGEDYDRWMRSALAWFETGSAADRRGLTALACLDENASPVEPELEPPEDYLVGDWRDGMWT